MWQHFKDKIAMKMYKSINDLEIKITELLSETTKQQTKSITSFEYVTKSYNSIFN